ncbi:something about silencing 10 family protein [Aspergillus clavatus NRRL 1]|uniref:Sas10/Utp3 family protein n=1 Tax=Aspergillus clavatus (strain ATCC 1007 / CBS 513.65 / DSM 816 / NCTC 3887 / NRRL 1 / QM 1276 / 107) TaxID=344612 RepID=A1CQ03_ASPCL|nr:Sas10/Utp3 family protein [Aspergillus clavatus NRRL 1]EAW07724.1 Sas10/Utp3 family protein [Aspergillus clavatus NRRL 1]
MAKKRKAGGRPAGQNSAKVSERTKFAYEERFEDSEDEFQAGRDQILLEEAPEAKRRRKLAEQEESLQPSDEEIMAYESMDEDDLDDEEDYGEDVYEDEDEDEDDMEIGFSKSKKSRRGESPDEDEEEGIAAWGTSKKDLYNADQIETEADALEEEAEAKRLQQKHLQAINEEDFGFDESEWVESGKAQEDVEDEGGVVTEVLPQLEITDDMSTEEKLKILKSRYPEFEPLAKDYVDLQARHKELEKAAESTKLPEDEDALLGPAPVPVIKFRALSAYLGAISMYFLLLSSSQDGSGNPAPLSPVEIRAHPVMGSLVKFRKLWETVKDLSAPEISQADVTEKAKSDAQTKASVSITKKQSQKSKDSQQPKKSKKEQKQSRAQRAAEAAQAEAEARRAEKLAETEANLADLDKLVKEPSRKRKIQKITSAENADNSDFGDEDALTAKEAEEKARQKRSLRFYTSQMAQKANKRNAAGRDAGGDADLPYRERLRDRQARLNAEAEKRGKQRPDKMEELGGDSDEEDHRVAREIRGGGSGTDDDEYYDMVAARSKQRKDDKKARADAYAEAAREGGRVEIQEEVRPDGKRAITYQIEKNKGLAPKRNKDSRNPRVKKRKKFEEKKKKLSSIRQVYKGGEGRGGYGGELTGIKKNLVKSIKL